MDAEENLKSKSLYKIELCLLRIMPALIALVYLVNTVFSYMGIDLPILSYIAGISLIPIISMYISSYVFRFCSCHRMFLYYIALNNITNIYDLYIGIPISDRNLLVLHLIIAGIFLFMILYTHVKHHKKSAIKDNK